VADRWHLLRNLAQTLEQFSKRMVPLVETRRVPSLL
jgi:hypothetical protein